MRVAKPKIEKSFAEVERGKIFSRQINEFLNNNFSLFTVIIFVLIILAGYYFVLAPKYEATKNNIALVNKEREDNFESKERELRKIKELLLNYSKISPQYISKINVIVPKRNNKEEIFTELNYLVSSIGLSLESLSIKEIVTRNPKQVKANNTFAEDKQIKSIKIDISVKGTDYDAFKNLLYSLENNLRLIDIESIDFNPGSRSTNLSLTTYFTD